MLTDLNTGIFTAVLEPSRIIAATAEILTIRRHQYPGIDLVRFLDALCAVPLKRRMALPESRHATIAQFDSLPEGPITVSRLFECLDAELTENVAVIADPGDALFGAIDLTIHSRSEFIGCAYYASLGFAVPASIGLQLAKPGWRPLVLVGDGAFQMTGLELTTAARYGLTPIVVVLDNKVPVDYRAMPHAIFASPQVVGVGLTEQAAQERGVPHVVATYNYYDTAYGSSRRWPTPCGCAWARTPSRRPSTCIPRFRRWPSGLSVCCPCDGGCCACKHTLMIPPTHPRTVVRTACQWMAEDELP